MIKEFDNINDIDNLAIKFNYKKHDVDKIPNLYIGEKIEFENNMYIIKEFYCEEDGNFIKLIICARNVNNK